MCTVSVIQLPGDLIRIACNRDELHTRPTALPPRLFELAGGRRAVFPTDPQAGGTWIGANDAGLVMFLLNRRRGWSARPVGAARSRGQVICSLLACTDADEVIARASAAVDPRDFEPFQLVAVHQATGSAEFVSDGQRLSVRRWTLDQLPRLFTSSSLGDELVGPPRTELFDRMIVFAEGNPTGEMQDAFHRHSWPDRGYLSVCMRRRDARTVSYTTLELSAVRAVMRYQPDPGKHARQSPTVDSVIEIAPSKALAAAAP